MKYAYILLSEANQEYEDAINWYLGKSTTAAEHFIEYVDLQLT